MNVKKNVDVSSSFQTCSELGKVSLSQFIHFYDLRCNIPLYVFFLSIWKSIQNMSLPSTLFHKVTGVTRTKDLY